MGGEKLKEISVQYPSDWKEAIKERFAPAWLKKQWPVKYKKETLEARALYPLVKLPEESPEELPVMRFVKFEGGTGE